MNAKISETIKARKLQLKETMQILEILVRRTCILSEICWFRQYQLIYHAHSHKSQEFVSPTFMKTFFFMVHFYFVFKYLLTC